MTATTFRDLRPMLAGEVIDVPRDAARYVMEPKLDGCRLMWSVYDVGGDERSVQVVTRSGKDHSGRFPAITDELEKLPDGTVLDGELVHATRGWGGVQSAIGSNGVATDPDLVLYVFDVPYFGDNDMRQQPLSVRRQLLEMLFDEMGWNERSRVYLVPQRPASRELHDSLVENGFEGSMLKRLDAPYISGDRRPWWLKLKHRSTVDCEVIGFYDPTSGSKYDGNAVGGLRFRTPDGYEGRAAGMGDKLRMQMHEHPEQFVGRTVEIAYNKGATTNGALRHPRFLRFRDE